MILVVLLVAAIGSVIAGWQIARAITRPLRRTADLLDAVAGKNLSGSIELDSKDEMGQMAGSLNVALGSLREALTTIDENVQTLAGASEELSAVSNEMAGSAEETSAQSGVVSAASEQVSASVESVAAAVEEFSASVTEISKNATTAAQVAHEASEMAQVVNENIGRLDQSSTEIGNVVSLITSIAEQTNLLALNATIEAARAGDAGKGFAVVANEVKDLASETARATDDISKRSRPTRAWPSVRWARS
jgi:methyl-accepting chemotaxis protein